MKQLKLVKLKDKIFPKEVKNVYETTADMWETLICGLRKYQNNKSL